ncbi:hypothetical protein H8784_19670 [Parabacteroides acidifaciens]|uniref:DUF6383 domain-containing protein n=1 Tax=Parabacteroides acidifaciens TaxID=2290935 RepID=A0A3D8H8M2_9BACT|nr:DUF6383 domain-containing protein [Parabacteroides acidifaciens]MBC8603927.1 hypothetical protein [Parabacteroides acidifaciens]RDU47329.1 hypothetical protein DWU89_20190 [Parabacteroides acidifaciens]
MNKKFSTLLTGALLVGSVAANAAGINVNKVDKIEQLASGSRYYVLSTTKATGTTGSPAEIATGVYMDAGVVKAGDVTGFTTLDKINPMLWSIKVNAVAGANRFVFTNKAEGMTLSFDPANAIDVSTAALAADGSAEAVKKASQLTDVETEWSWVTTKDAGTELAELKGLAAYFHKDSVMKLYQVTGTGNVFAVKYANTATPTITNATEVAVQAAQPATIVLTAKDLNVLGTGANKYFTIDAGQTLKGNIFANTKWQAQNIVAKDGAGSVGDNTDPASFTYEANDATSPKLAATSGAVVLNKIESDKPSFKFAHVDTAFWAGVSENENKWYEFAVAEGKVTKNGDGAIVTLDSLARKGGLTQKAFEFTFTRDLFKDSVIVTVQAAGLMEKKDDLVEVWGKKTYWHTANDALKTYLTLSYQKLNDANVLTLDQANQDNNIPFYVSGALVESVATSVNDGLYYIKNKAGQFLAAPIYNTINGTTSAAKWVTVNGGLQEVAHMPAYQWVVLKDKIYSETAKKTSTVTITNREFTAIEGAKVQLNQKDEASCLYTNTIGNLAITDKDSLKFVQIEDLAILSDTLLGYKNFEADSLLVNRYTFNYLHDYADSKYIVKSAKDSLAQATDGTQPFVIEAEDNIYDYGYEVTPAIAERIAGLKQLRRQAYQVYLPTAKGKLYLSKNTEDKYMFTVPAYGTPSTFLFKEENDLTNNKHYHALVAVDGTLGTLASESYTKVGVIDASAILEDQKMSEQRTSAFNIGKYDAPLYRRFNSMKLEGNEGDAADTLRFVEKYRKEYLQVEANENFKVKGIDFLGIYTPDFTKDGKSFIVDTAFVNRWSGNIKPQYLISIDRNDAPGKDAEPCPLEHNHGYDKDGKPLDKWSCSHATPATAGFHYGKYLVNFADSVDHAAKSADYGWKGYTRAGFVKAVHMGDSLYILAGQFADVTPATFDTAAIHKAVKDKKYAEEYIVDLQGDEHKLVTWSMRFVDPENAANEAEEDRAFLMESQGEERDIAPTTGEWLKMQNGCIVLSGTAGAPSTFDQITGADDALIFNVEMGNKDDMATDNEQIATSEVTVIAQQGAVRIANAEGKKVVITNILGQTIANTVITSSDAVIAAPAGVVVVAIEGEEAVKAIVK